MNALAALGRWVLDGFSHIGRLSYFVVEGLRGLAEVRLYALRFPSASWILIALPLSGARRFPRRAFVSLHHVHHLCKVLVGWS